MRSTIKYGLITGLVSGIFLFGSFTLCTWLKAKYGWSVQMATIRGIGGLISIPIQAIGIFMAMQNVKRLNGSLSYGLALKTGITVAITIAILIALFSLIYCQYINPGYADYMVHDAQQAMIAEGASQQDIGQKSLKVAHEFATVTQIMQALIGQFVTGCIISAIIGLFVKTKTTP